jgi:sugar transferase (PEP-CTERM/EpsH1 system associated)
MPKRIRIMHIVEALGVGGGIENGLANLIQQMDPSRFEHIACAVFRLGPQLERYRSDHVQVVCLEQKARRFAIQVRPLARIIREQKPDIVHSRNWGTLDAIIAARLVRTCSIIHSEHGVEMNPSAEPSRRSWLRRIGFELADRVFSVSYQLRDALAKRTGFSERKIEVIHNGVESKRFRQDPSARSRFRQELGIADDDFCIGCVGRLNRIKDYPTTLRAVEVFSKACVSWRLLIAGSGPELVGLKEFVSANPGLHRRVHFLGTTERVPEFLNAIDTYVLSSLWEGISNSLLEAMAIGLPVIASDTGGTPEVIVDGESGLSFPVGDFQRLADRLLMLYRQPDVRDRLGKHAQERIRRDFSLDAMVRSYEHMYDAVATNRAA